VTLSFPVAPMKAAIGTLPTDDERWAYEIKWDGYRTIAFVDGGRVRLQSTNLLDVTAKWPEIGDLAGSVHAGRAVLDGELVVFDDAGRPRFELIQRHERQAAYVVFDVLSVDEHDTIALAYEDRRRLLTELVEPGDNWTVPNHRVGGGHELLEATAAQGLEGVMAKRLGSTYQPGKRSPNWRKVKNRVPVEVVIGGYTAGSGNRTSTFGALLVGRRLDDRPVDRPDAPLAFAGGVGTGFDRRTLADLSARFAELRTERCPFDPPPPREYVRYATWVEPVLTARIEITEFTNEGFVRHASFLGLA
jgi:bifunctional non-homologous end joining protein LigD